MKNFDKKIILKLPWFSMSLYNPKKTTSKDLQIYLSPATLAGITAVYQI